MSAGRSHYSDERVARAAAFAIAVALPTYYALRGGSYDVVVRQEEAIAVWLVVALGFGLGLFPRARQSRTVVVPLAAVGLLAAWLALGLSWTDSDERTVSELARVIHYAGLLILAWGLLDRATWRAAAAGLATAAVAISSLAVASRLAPGLFPGANDVGQALDIDRLNYPFNYWNAVGAWSAMAIAISLGWSAHARELWARMAAAAAIPVCGLAVYFTYSRAAAIGSALALLFVLALSRNRWVAAVHALVAGGATAVAILEARGHPELKEAVGGAGGGATALVLLLGAAVCAGAGLLTRAAGGDERWRLPKVPGRVGAVAAVLAVVVVAFTVGHDDISRGWDQFRGAERPSHSDTSSDPASRLTNLAGNRYPEWRSALRAFKTEPFHGIGPGTFEYWWNRDDGREYVRDAHSLYFESLAELGVPGLLLVVLLLGGLAFCALRARFRAEDPADLAPLVALSAAFLVFLFHAGVDWMWESTAPAALALGCAAVAAGSRATPGAGLRVPARAAIVAVAVVAMLVQVPGLVSTSKIRDSQEEVRAGDPARALELANDGVHAQPWAASPYTQRALVEEDARDLKAAAIDLRRAVLREPTSWRPPFILARVEAKRGRVRQSLAAYRAARRLRPESPLFSPVPSTR